MPSPEYEAILSSSLLYLFSLYNMMVLFVNRNFKCHTNVCLGVYFTLETKINLFNLELYISFLKAYLD